MNNYRLSDQDRMTLQFKVTRKLRELILKGEFKMGERLVQEEWAKKLGVSRMPLREALRQLEIEGLVRIEPRRGAIVTPISIEDIEEIYRLRALLEGEAVVQSYEFLTDEDFEELEELHVKMSGLQGDDEDIEEYMDLNEKFHHVLMGGCSWRRIKGFIDTLWKGIPSLTPSLLANTIDEGRKEHFQMLQYARQGNGEELRKVTEKHILRTRDNLIHMMKNDRD
ncbi:GntR family transcriptional regulator [Sporosarcina sp. ACRSL]|uniref:GntR family transcriptional regulator n=1 Tax=Sporosarcina sp. ACRSL TaxID=2918215 RepID=UPI001EF64E45|nr:GntR family transcriptional regulator [Sporosarcina sp. ACRSL]MCG7344088.1 GntR family transcriptional regulator [Sporosarcina sp. ACRSL]